MCIQVGDEERAMNNEKNLQKAAEEQLFRVAVRGSGTVTWSGKEDRDDED